jgi:hypothetical protein
MTLSRKYSELELAREVLVSCTGNIVVGERCELELVRDANLEICTYSNSRAIRPREDSGMRSLELAEKEDVKRRAPLGRRWLGANAPRRRVAAAAG